MAQGDSIHPSGIKGSLGYSYSDVENALGKLIRCGFLNYREAKKEGPGAPRTIYFPSPMGMEAFRQLAGRYPDRRPGPSPNHAVQRTCQILGIRRKPPRRFDILYEENGVDRAIEVESGSNGDPQIRENVRQDPEACHPRSVVPDIHLGFVGRRKRE